MASRQATGTVQGQPHTTWHDLVPSSRLGMALNSELPGLPTPSLATRSTRPSSVQIALVSFLFLLFFFLKKGLGFCC